MVGIYFIAGIIILVVNYSQLGSAFSQIISGAFHPESIAGGIVGVIIMDSNERLFLMKLAWIGSHSTLAVKTNIRPLKGW